MKLAPGTPTRGDESILRSLLTWILWTFERIFEPTDPGPLHREWLRCMEDWTYPCPDCGANAGEPCSGLGVTEK